MLARTKEQIATLRILEDVFADRIELGYDDDAAPDVEELAAIVETISTLALIGEPLPADRLVRAAAVCVALAERFDSH